MSRLPSITEGQAVPEAERWAFDEMIRTRGRILPGYAPMLHCAELVGRVVNVGSFFRFNSSLPASTLEAIALAVSTELGDAYEQQVHRKAAAQSGLPASVISAICEKQAFAAHDSEAQLAAVCARELLQTHALSDESFAAIRNRLSERGVVEVIGAIGFYAMLAYMHTALRITPEPAKA